MGLTAATYLGDNTVPILDGLVAALRSAGIDIAVDESAGRDSLDGRAHAADVDLVWMCGSLSMVLLDEGVLDHGIVAAPVFSGEQGAVYRSAIIARTDGPGTIDEALGGSIGVNEPESWSGHHGLRRHLGDRWFPDEVPPGSHRGSIDAVAAGACDAAGIDVTVWRHVVATEPAAVADLQVIDLTDDWPAPPLMFRLGSGLGSVAITALLEAKVAGLERVVPAMAASYEELRPR